MANVAQGTREPWDGPEYWTTWLPLALLLGILLGAAFPESFWRWPFAVMMAQLPVMIVTTGEIGALFVLGLGLVGVLTLIGLPFSWFGSLIRRWIERERQA